MDSTAAKFLHSPSKPNGDGFILTHGAGGNANAPLLIALANALSDEGFSVVRYNLPFRQQRPFGPPRPASAAQDREGLKNEVAAMRKQVSGRSRNPSPRWRAGAPSRPSPPTRRGCPSWRLRGSASARSGSGPAGGRRPSAAWGS